MSATATERVEYWGGPLDGLHLATDVGQADGLQLPIKHHRDGVYVLTTYPAKAFGGPFPQRRRVWAWWHAAVRK